MLVVDGEGVSGVLLWETILILISDTSCSYNAQNRKKTEASHWWREEMIRLIAVDMQSVPSSCV